MGIILVLGIAQKTVPTTTYRPLKKSALEDLVSDIKVTVSSTSMLSQLEVNMKLSEQYEQIIKTTAADEIEEYETVDAWEDAGNYWVYCRLSIARYRQIKEEQKKTRCCWQRIICKRAARLNGLASVCRQ